MVSAVILAAGSGMRMKSGTNKVFMELCGKSVLARTLTAFSCCRDIGEIIIVCRKGEKTKAEKEAKSVLNMPCKIVAGGKERQDSVANALKLIDKETKIICIHDAARCLVKPELIERCIKSAYRFGSGCAGAGVKDTLKKTEGDNIISTIDRKSVIAVQTPQAFEKGLILSAHEQAKKEGFIGTDESVLVERLGKKVKYVESDCENVKITTRQDMDYAKYLINKKADLKIGHGYDAHRFAEGRKLLMGGVEIPNLKGLLGHSDADVLIHAIIDALLGAAGLTDIGAHFPPSDEKYKGISSIELLEKTALMLECKCIGIENIDATVVMEEPKIYGYIKDMRENIAGALRIDVERINVKATTAEGMGFTGTGEGAAAYAVCLIKNFGGD